MLQQLREAFPGVGLYRYVVLDRDSKFDDDVIAFLESTGLKPKRTSIEAPWQNGTAERWIGSCRRELLDDIIPLNESYLRRLLREYVAYHHDDRTHDSLEKDTPNRRPVYNPPAHAAEVTPAHAWAVFITDTPGAPRREYLPDPGCRRCERPKSTKSFLAQSGRQ